MQGLHLYLTREEAEVLASLVGDAELTAAQALVLARIARTVADALARVP